MKAGQPATQGSRIPSLGPRGEGWVALQFVCLGLVAAGGLLAPGTPNGALTAAGALLLVGGLALAGWGLLTLQAGNALTALPHPRAEAELVETGAYRLARHPIYGGLILVALAWSAITASVPAAVASIVLAVTLDLKRRREEAWLADRFPGYPAYRARTKALIPFLY